MQSPLASACILQAVLGRAVSSWTEADMAMAIADVKFVPSSLKHSLKVVKLQNFPRHKELRLHLELVPVIIFVPVPGH